MITLEPLFSILICKYLFNFPISNSTIKANFRDREAYLLSLYSFLFFDKNNNYLKESEIPKKYNAALIQITNRTYLFNSLIDDNDMKELAFLHKI